MPCQHPSVANRGWMYCTVQYSSTNEYCTVQPPTFTTHLLFTTTTQSNTHNANMETTKSQAHPASIFHFMYWPSHLSPSPQLPHPASASASEAQLPDPSIPIPKYKYTDIDLSTALPLSQDHYLDYGSFGRS
jgi:hypothetical protein